MESPDVSLLPSRNLATGTVLGNLFDCHIYYRPKGFLSRFFYGLQKRWRCLCAFFEVFQKVTAETYSTLFTSLNTATESFKAKTSFSSASFSKYTLISTLSWIWLKPTPERLFGKYERAYCKQGYDHDQYRRQRNPTVPPKIHEPRFRHSFIL